MLVEDTISFESKIPGTKTTIHTVLTNEEYGEQNYQPVYNKPIQALQTLALLRDVFPITPKRKIDRLKNDMQGLKNGTSFMLIMGQCAQDTDDDGPGRVEAQASALYDMGAEIADHTEQALGLDVIVALRDVHEKPRSKARNPDGTLTFRGGLVNSVEQPDADPSRLLKTYNYQKRFANQLDRKAVENGRVMARATEVLSFAYHFGQQQETTSGVAEYIWVGARTMGNRLDGQTPEPSDHVQYAALQDNAVGTKCSGDTKPDDLKETIAILGRHGEQRISVIFRVGAAEVDEKLGPLLDVVAEYGKNVDIFCDPMHGNTETDVETGLKIRKTDNIKYELASTYRQCAEKGLTLAGAVLEVTAKDATEVIGDDVPHIDPDRYLTKVDPNMTKKQTIAVIDALASVMHPKLAV